MFVVKFSEWIHQVPFSYFTILTLCIVPITARQAVFDDVYEGIRIPKDTLIHFPALVINMSPFLWGPDADQFRPERWENIRDAPNTQFLTFQHGMIPRAYT
jgi:cytochrome P450